MPTERVTKPKVLAFGPLALTDPAIVAEFESSFDIHYIQPTDRAGTVATVTKAAETEGPFYGALIGMKNGRYERFDGELFGPLLPSLKIVASVNAGYNEVDLEWFTKNKVYVTNTLNAVAEPTADMAIMLILNTLRDFSRYERKVRAGEWAGSPIFPPKDPHGLLLGIIGMGKIGKHVARKAQVFGMRIQYFNRHQIPAEEETKLNVKYASFEDLLKTSDVVCINCPLTDDTRGMVGEKEFAIMKDGVFLINTGRGAVVEEKALIQALSKGKVERAGFDVFDNEPNINPFFMVNDRCTVQPHMGSFTDVAWKNAYHECLANISALYLDGKPISPVNSFDLA
ncbi:glycerate-and formate-dehydrogenase [Massarina eburnea CBS 473.64]|uniref:Glycerate-and formate-dehydrogenase n=1 Tax=Massarina eburnea CBS 473.64 TaxID=1395130 RepID=A0A6A6SCG6_9PLEO|nr:glycerate-and formate-dehydrogenase [Massarina eburnea CBS 473.64]